MKVSEIRRVLSDLENIYSAAGARGPAKDMAALCEAMASADQEDVDSFLRRLDPVVSTSGNPAARAEAHLLALIDAGHDQDRFDATFEKLVSDKALKAQELDMIGAAYAMAPEFARLYKTRAEKLRQIKETFHEKKNFEARGKVIDELLPWQ